MICSDRDAGHAVMNVDAIQPLTHRWIKGKMAPARRGSWPATNRSGELMTDSGSPVARHG
jgi:hypothetical protein